MQNSLPFCLCTGAHRWNLPLMRRAARAASRSDKSSLLDLSSEESVMKKKFYVIVLFLLLCMAVWIGCHQKDNVYHWAILQNGRHQMDEAQIQRINERLLEMGIEGQIEFHYVTIEGLVTPEVVKQTYKDLGRKMDFVSISPSLVAFTKKEWQETFLELSEELQNGGLRAFYERIPEPVWEANRMAGGIYSFSWSNMVRPYGFGFPHQLVEKIGKEKLLTLKQARGIEDESIWKELYEANGEQAICLWTSISWGMSQPTKELPYKRNTLDKFSEGWSRHYFWMLMDDVGYNYETGKFEWMGESETYKELFEGIVDFYKKGYIRNVNIDTVIEYEIDIHAAQGYFGYDNKVEDNIENPYVRLWIPSWEELQLDPRSPYAYLYSFVYKEAREGWQEVLTAVGVDEEITEIINRKDDMTLTRILYEDMELNSAVPPQIEDMYTFLEDVYSRLEKREVTDFIFNPLPVQEIMRECERRAGAYAGTNFFIEGKTWSEYIVDIKKVEEVWESYLSVMEESPIHELVEEVNRQYQEWIQS